jgi:4-amino-4-deoxy-L-arabinose transferase-like glycosyltransferase
LSTIQETISPATTVSQSTSPRYARLVFGFIAFFFVVTSLVSTGLNRYHADEWFYSDGALRMMESGDYFTPTYADGAHRFNKPVLPYWVTLAGFKIFGVSLWSARVLFVLAGCAALWLTWRTARVLFDSDEIALLAVAIFGSSHKLITLSGCSITDILFMLCMLLSQYGFVRLLFANDRRFSAYACAYMGSGLALATRGILGFTPVFFAWAFAWLWRRKEPNGLRRLVNMPAMLGGAAIGGGWVIAMLILHGQTFVSEFLHDQAASRFHDSLWYINIFAYPGAILTEFVPWLVPLAIVLVQDHRRFFSCVKNLGARAWFVLGWTALVIVMYTPGNLTRARYMLPAFPLFAVLLAALLLKAAPGLLDRTWRGIALVFAAIAIPAGISIASIGTRIDARLLLGGLELLGLALAVAVFAWKVQRISPLMIPAGMIALFAIADVHLRSWAIEHPEPAAAALIARHAPQDGEIMTVGSYSRKCAARLRLYTNNRFRFAAADSAQRANDAHPFALAFGEPVAQQLDLKGYQVFEADNLLGDFKFSELWRAVRDGGAQEYVDQHSTKWFVAFRTQTQDQKPETIP